MNPQPAKKTVAAAKRTTLDRVAMQSENVLFTKENYKWMLIGLIVMAFGFILMAGGKSADPSIFNDKDIYSPMRITVAPILIVAGLVIEIFAIMKKSK